MVCCSHSVSKEEGGMKEVGILILGMLTMAFCDYLSSLCYRLKYGPKRDAPPIDAKEAVPLAKSDQALSSELRTLHEWGMQRSLVTLGLANPDIAPFCTLETVVHYLDENGFVKHGSFEGFFELIQRSEEHGLSVPRACIYVLKQGAVTLWACGSTHWSFVSPEYPLKEAMGDCAIPVRDRRGKEMTIALAGKEEEGALEDALHLLQDFDDVEGYVTAYVIHSALAYSRNLPELSLLQKQIVERMLSTIDVQPFATTHLPNLALLAHNEILNGSAE
jgi:hypothetical protein